MARWWVRYLNNFVAAINNFFFFSFTMVFSAFPCPLRPQSRSPPTFLARPSRSPSQAGGGKAFPSRARSLRQLPPRLGTTSPGSRFRFASVFGLAADSFDARWIRMFRWRFWNQRNFMLDSHLGFEWGRLCGCGCRYSVVHALIWIWRFMIMENKK